MSIITDIESVTTESRNTIYREVSKIITAQLKKNSTDDVKEFFMILGQFTRHPDLEKLLRSTGMQVANFSSFWATPSYSKEASIAVRGYLRILVELCNHQCEVEK